MSGWQGERTLFFAGRDVCYPMPAWIFYAMLGVRKDLGKPWEIIPCAFYFALSVRRVPCLIRINGVRYWRAGLPLLIRIRCRVNLKLFRRPRAAA